MNLSNIYEVLMALAVVAGFLITVGRFLAGVNANTRATEKLTDVFEKFVSKTDETLLDHEVRLTVLEQQKKEQ